MMQHASGGTGRREATDINQLVSKHIDLAYHGIRAHKCDLRITINRAYRQLSSMSLPGIRYGSLDAP